MGETESNMFSNTLDSGLPPRVNKLSKIAIFYSYILIRIKYEFVYDNVDDEDLSSQELDEMFGDDEPDAFQSIVSSDTEDDGGGQSIDPDEIPDPDPIPQALMSDDDDDDGDDDSNGKRSPKISKVIGIGCAAFISILLISGYFLKNQVLDIFPAAAVIYDTIGLGSEEVGAGLKILSVKSSRGVEKGKETLIIRGQIKNISNIVRIVPMVQVDLFDGEGNSIQNAQVATLRNKLKPGKRVNFKARIIKPSPLARKLEVTFKTHDVDGTGLDKVSDSNDNKLIPTPQ